MDYVHWRELIVLIFSPHGDWCLNGFWEEHQARESESEFLKMTARLASQMVRYLLPGLPAFEMKVEQHQVALPLPQSELIRKWNRDFPEGTPDRFFYFPLSTPALRMSANGKK